jgi:glycosyltransferase involved in cell wall biosynthesis
LLVEPGDAAALAQALDRLSRDEELRARLGAAARRAAEGSHTWEHNAARVFDSFHKYAWQVGPGR